jgi:hypothetical protein
MAYTTIDDPSAHFQTLLYTGDGTSSQAQTNTGNSDLQPDWVWIKKRAGGTARAHQLYDSTRGVTKLLHSNSDGAESTQSAGLTAFGSDGFTVGDDDGIGANTATYVAWQWKANGGTTSSNNDGSYTSTVQANTTTGFSIVKYGDATSFSSSSPATVGHGLGKAPKWIIIKNLDGTRSWGVHHAGLTSAGKIIYLDLTNAEADSSGFMNSTAPSSTVFTVNTLNVANGNNLEYIAYCFAEIQGYSKFGSYEGNDATDGPFVYTGFKPAWVMIKHISGSAGGTKNWYMYDNKRSPQNVNDNTLIANGNDAEGADSAFDIDMLSNGFKIRNAEGAINNAASYIYMAFAEHPFVSSKGVPVTAR